MKIPKLSHRQIHSKAQIQQKSRIENKKKKQKEKEKRCFKTSTCKNAKLPDWCKNHFHPWHIEHLSMRINPMQNDCTLKKKQKKKNLNPEQEKTKKQKKQTSTSNSHWSPAPRGGKNKKRQREWLKRQKIYIEKRLPKKGGSVENNTHRAGVKCRNKNRVRAQSAEWRRREAERSSALLAHSVSGSGSRSRTPLPSCDSSCLSVNRLARAQSESALAPRCSG